MITNDNSQATSSNESSKEPQAKTGLIGKLKSMFSTQSSIAGTPKGKNL